ncbi:hypothetical protein [Staphylococcus petrasii]|uniref:hypothetical protein n=1 Tax=Staphylococcus petrasii TaxID=1276936 RepID=UPI000E043E0C|nr:hypothetical protein [Staphylococcus petrasii]SUM58874.1 Uncharacterised protein [Staphylococcus petrasii]
MIPEERGSYTLSQEEAIIFATAEFKPFKNLLENELTTANLLELYEKIEKSKSSNL